VTLAPRTGLPPAFLLSLGIHLIVIFGFLLSPAGDSARQVANRAVTILLTPTEQALETAAADAAANQLGSPSMSAAPAVPSPTANPTPPTDPMVEGSAQTPITGSATVAYPASAAVAARAALDAEYLRQWQADIERFGNAYYRGLARRYGNGDVRLRVTVTSDGALQRIDLLGSSGISELDRAAVDTVEKLAPFPPFPAALAREAGELAIIRTWQFRR
jgi:TonB family protein